MAAPEASRGNRPAPGRSPWPLRRIGAVARVTLVQGLRMRLWLLAPLALVVLVVADASSPRFDPIFEGIPAAFSATLLVMAILAVLVGVFFATYSIPSEIESKTAYTVCTKPLSALEFVAGKTAGMSLLLLGMLLVVAAGGYGYICVRAAEIRALAGRHVAEARGWVAHPADLNAVEAVAQLGPLQTYRYHRADSGPDFAILDPQGLASDTSLRWILSNSGARFRWDLTQTPLRDWVGEGSAELRLQLTTRAAGTASAKPPQLIVGLVPTPESRASGRNVPPETEQRMAQKFDVPPDGLLRIPVVMAGGPAAPGSLQMPPDGAAELQLYATGDGLLVGAGPASASIQGSAGKVSPSIPGPAVAVGSERGRQWLVGRSRVPRAQAAFRFDTVPEGELAAGNTAVEIGFSLQSWGPPTITSTARAAFLNPQTGQTRSFEFTPEGYHSTILYLDRTFWHGGPLEVRLESETDDDFLGLLPESVRIRAEGGPFVLNLAKSMLNVWCFGSVLVAFGVLLSTRFAWFVSVLGGMTFVIMAFARDFIRHQTVVADMAAALLRWGQDWPQWLHWEWIVNRVSPPLPSLQSMLPGENVRMGQAMALAELGDAFLWSAIAVAALVLVGALLFRHREVAA